MRKVLIGFLAMSLCVLGLGAMWIVRADDDDTVKFTANLDGFQEVPAILSEGKGTLTLTLNRVAKTFKFELTYSGLSAPVTQAHIHFGRVHTPGGIMVFFCSNLTTPPPPAGTQNCPATGGSVMGTISPGNVVGPAAQNVTAGDFDALTDALFSNSAYANVHTQKFGAGEIRGQIHLQDGRRDHDDK